MERIKQANSFLSYIGSHQELSIGNISNKQFISQLQEADLNQDIWVGVVARKEIIQSGKGGKKTDCHNLKWIWADIDVEKDGITYEESITKVKSICNPSLIINSGHGYHIYWLLDKVMTIIDIERIENLLKSVCIKIGSDPSRVNVNSVMRLPGTINLKNSAEPKIVEIIEKGNAKYSIEQLEAIFEVKSPAKRQGNNLMHQIETVSDGSRNQTLFKEILMLLDRGWNDSQVATELEIKYVDQLGLSQNEFAATFKSALSKFNVENIKNPNVIRASKTKSKVMSLLNDGNIESAVAVLEQLQEKPKEIVFESYNLGDDVEDSNTKMYKIGCSEIDDCSPFESASVCLIAGLTGSGKTTVALNLVKAFQQNNNCDILFLESDSETSLLGIKQLAKKIKVGSLNIVQFPRFEDMKKGFMSILEQYKSIKGKYPDIVFIDTFEKMNKSSENYNLKLNTECLSYICQQTNSLFISLSQFSSTVYKASKKTSNIYPMAIQQGGMDVINNVNTWMSMKRQSIVDPTGEILHRNHLYFGKVRNSMASTMLYDKYLSVPFRTDDFNMLFSVSSLKEDTQ